MAASAVTLATQATDATKDEPARSTRANEDAKGPLNNDSSSNVLFHPPAAHGENSGESGNDDDDEDNCNSMG